MIRRFLARRMASHWASVACSCMIAGDYPQAAAAIRLQSKWARRHAEWRHRPSFFNSHGFLVIALAAIVVGVVVAWGLQ